jgi:hypothetical protein
VSYATVCPRCQQWQHATLDGDCPNRCAAQDLATVARRVKVEGHEHEVCWHLNRIGARSETQKHCLDCGRTVEPVGNPRADRNCPHTFKLDGSRADEHPGSRWVCATCETVVWERGS